jgi:AraC-like DNA-binding protein
MEMESVRDIELTVPYLQRKQVVSNSRYRWNCWDRSKNPFVILQWTLSGEGIFEGGQGRFRVPAGHAFIAVVPERSTYYYPPEYREPWVFSWLNFYGTLACDLFSKLQAEFGPVIPLASRGAAATSLRRLLAKGARTESSERFQTSLQAYAFILEWWREASQPTGSPEDRLGRALRFSQEHFREPLGVKELASEAGMSREHFSRIFTEWTGETPSACLQRLRMNEATIFIRETDLPLSEIAMRSGFYSERHLMRTFQRVHALSPSQYRRQHAAG